MHTQVRSQSASVRSCCGAALLAFLLDFPLGPARLKQHVGFLLANLEYEYESGRLAVLDMLAQVVAKFPAEVLQVRGKEQPGGGGRGGGVVCLPS